MRRRATQAQKAEWWVAYRMRLIGFTPGIGGNPRGVTHWMAREPGHRLTRLCDMTGSWNSAPHGVVDCMSCLVEMARLEGLMSKETTNEKVERLLLEALAALPKGKNAKLHELTEHVLRVGKVKGTQHEAYGLVGRALSRLKNAAKARYVGGRGCGWRLP